MDFRNVNLVWTSVLVETLHRLGLATAVICPGSRSAPLAIAFAQHPAIEAIPVLDERSAAFFALGRARQSGQATALVCSSGTAGANFFPAVIEARESRVPLLVLTGDRPPELRQCNAGQTIDQQKLYGNYPNAFYELALPSLAAGRLAYVRQTVQQAWTLTRYPVPGVVHLNCPFRDPLAPIAQPEAEALASTFDTASFFANLQPSAPSLAERAAAPAIPDRLANSERGLIIAGVAQPQQPRRYCEAIAALSQHTGFPVLAEGLSPVRNHAALFSSMVSTYDLILRHPSLAAELAPAVVLRIGEMPTSKVLRQWLQTTQPLQWVVDVGDRNLDPLHLRTTPLRCTAERLAASLPPASSPPSAYRQRWCQVENQFRHAIDSLFAATDEWIEGKVAWLLSQCLPANTPLFIANSMPVRDVEWFWRPGDSQVQPYVNRGANGIDGTLSTALGVAHRQAPSVLLTGDLALLHDTNGWLLCPQFHGHLSIVLINNQGGGIFETLPIAHFEPPFEDFFATPQRVDFANLVAAYGGSHQVMHSWAELATSLRRLPPTGIRILEVRCDRKANARWLQEHFGAIAQSASQP